MTRLDDETLTAYADGELPESEAQQVEARLADDAAARARLAALIEAGALARAAFSAPLDEPVPDTLRRTIEITPAGPRLVHDSDDEHDQGRAPGGGMPTFPPGRRWRPLALAASLALSVGLGAGYLAGRPDDTMRMAIDGATGPGALVAGGPLRQALDSAPSYTPVATSAGETTILASFHDAAGRFCREYEQIRRAPQPEGGLRGVACRGRAGTPAADAWRLELVAPLPEATRDETFRPAAGEATDAFVAAVEALRAGPSLDAEAERRQLR